MAVLSDRVIPNSSSPTVVSHYNADMVTATLYSAFGMQFRTWNSPWNNYRYGFNGKEVDDQMFGNGNELDYGMRVYDPRAGRFLSVDPLTRRFAKYSPYQYAGNKPIAFIDLDGREEYDPSSDPYFLKGIWDNAVDGLGNLLLRSADPIMEGFVIRKQLERQGYKLPNEKYISNHALSLVFDIHKENREFVISPERTFAEKLLEAGASAMDVLAILPMKGGSPMVLAAKANPVAGNAISRILRSLTISARTKEISSEFIDVARSDFSEGIVKRLTEFEAQSGAILEQSTGLKLRSLKKGEVGDYAVESGIIDGQSAAGKVIDQLGVPAKSEAISNYNSKAFYKSVKSHFEKSVDYILLDGRNMTEAQRAGVMNYIKENHSKDMNRLITIGF